MKAGICHPPFVPPLAYIYDLLRVGAEILIEFITQLGGLGAERADRLSNILLTVVDGYS